MAATQVSYVGDGSTKNFSVPFPYISREHVKVYLDNLIVLSPIHYVWVGPGTVQFDSTPHVGSKIFIRRETPADNQLVTFTNAAVLPEDDLNQSAQQLLYLIQETRSRLEGLMTGSFNGLTSEMTNAIIEQVLSSEVALALQARITDIDTAGQLLLDALMQRRLLGKPTDNYEAFILDTHNTKVTPTESFAERLSTITATGAGNAAAIISEQSARVSADEALASSISSVAASVGDVSAAVTAEASARATADSAIATTLSGVSTVANNAAAAVVTEASARVSGDAANASSITALGSTVSGHSSTISTLSSTTAALIDGVADLEARYGVSLNVNGYITGFTQFNDGESGTFAILADKFYIVDPVDDGQNPVAVFGIEDGLVVMRDVVIGNALIENLTVSKLTAGTLNADITVGTGKIIWTNGAYMKVTGIGFGSSNQFLEWFGPAMSISACTEANAIQYIKTNGDAYFGGSLSAGTLHNALTTTSLSSTAELTLGPFGTNGNPINVVLSYAAGFTFEQSGDHSASPHSWSGSIQLYRKIGTGSETLVTTLNVSGSDSHVYNSLFDLTLFEGAMSGSTTYTDSAGGSDDRTYRAVMVSRSGTHSDLVQFQNISIVATEE